MTIGQIKRGTHDRATMADRKAYVQIAVVGGATIRGYDSWLTPWSGLSGIVEQHMEDNESAVLEFKVLHMTEQELENYCEENGVAWVNHDQ